MQLCILKKQSGTHAGGREESPAENSRSSQCRARCRTDSVTSSTAGRDVNCHSRLVHHSHACRYCGSTSMAAAHDVGVSDNSRAGGGEATPPSPLLSRPRHGVAPPTLPPHSAPHPPPGRFRRAWFHAPYLLTSPCSRYAWKATLLRGIDSHHRAQRDLFFLGRCCCPGAPLTVSRTTGGTAACGVR